MPATTRLLAACVSFGLVAATAVARDGAAPVWLEWVRGDGAESCIDEGGFAAEVASELGGPPAEAAVRSHRRLSVRIQRSTQGTSGAAARWSAHLRLLGDDGTTVGSRALERGGDSCQPLTDALALMVALLLSDTGEGLPPAEVAGAPTEAGETTTPTTTAGMGTPTPTPTPTPTAGTPTPLNVSFGVPARPDAAATPALAGWAVSAEAGPAAGAGLLPGVAIAGEARLAIAVPSGPVVFASGDVWRTATSTAGTAGTAGGVRLDLWTVGLGICPLERRSSARAVGLCLGGEAGRLHASGFGFDMPFDKDRWAADLALGGELRQRIGGALFVALGLRAVVPLIRDQIVYSVSGQPPHSLFRMSPLAAVAGLRIGYGLR